MIAAELGCHLMRLPSGEKRVMALIREAIEKARAERHLARAATLRLSLRHFIAEHMRGCGR